MGSTISGGVSGGAARALENEAVEASGVEASSAAAGASGLNAQAQSGFDGTLSAGAGAAAADAATVQVTASSTEGAVRAGQLTTPIGVPDVVSANDLVTRESKLASLEQAVLPDERAAVRAELEAGKPEDLDAAFLKLLDNTRAPGTHTFTVGTHQAYVEVAQDGKVNGAFLPSDRELALAPALVNLTTDQRKDQLRQAGISERYLSTASDAQIVRAFTEVEARRQLGVVGDFTIPVTGRKPIHGGYLNEPSSISFSTGPGKTIGPPGGPHTVASSIAALDTLKTKENLEWPSGTPESRTKLRIEDAGFPVTDADKLATLQQTMTPEQATQLGTLFDTPPGLAPDALDVAYRSVLDARKTPGSKDLSFSISPLVEQLTERESGTVKELVGGTPVSFGAKFSVDASGKVNGKLLAVDEVARYASEVSSLAPEVKANALLDAGLDERWLQNASPQQVDYALGKIRLASTEPGTHSLDFSYSYQAQDYGESGDTGHHFVTGAVTLDVGSGGKVNGKTPLVETALATQLVMEKLPMAEKRLLLQQLGIPGEATRNISADGAADLLTRVTLETAKPGTHQLDFEVGRDTWRLALEVGTKGDIAGAGAVKLPPDPPIWKEVIGPILTVVGIVFPALYPVTSIIQAGMAISNGAKGLGLVAAVAGAAAGFSGLSDVAAGVSASTTTQFLSNVATAASAVDGIHQGVKDGNFLGVFSSVMSLASASGNLTGTKLDASFDSLVLAGRVAGYADQLKNGNNAGFISSMISEFSSGSGNTKTEGTVTGTDGHTVTYGSDGTDLGTWMDRNGERTEGGEETHDEDTTTGGTGGTDHTGTTGTAGTDSTGAKVDDTKGTTEKVTRVVRSGDTLSKIAQEMLGNANKWPELYAYNAEVLGANPNAIRPGQTLEMPPAEFGLPAPVRNAIISGAHIERTSSEYQLMNAAIDVFDVSRGAKVVPVLDAEAKTNISTAAMSLAPAAVTPSGGLTLAAFVNTPVNTVMLLNDAVASMIPGTKSNKVVSDAITTYVKEIGELAKTAASNPGGLVDGLERIVVKVATTVADPTKWGDTAKDTLSFVIKNTFGGSEGLAQKLAQDPGSIQPGDLMLQAVRAAAGLSNLALVGGGAKATVGLTDAALASVGTQVKIGPLIQGTFLRDSGDMLFSLSQLMHASEHAADFGLVKSTSNESLLALRAAVETHVASPGTVAINGMFKGVPATHFLNPTTGLNVVRDASGNFLAGYKLSADQIRIVRETGKLGGGG